MNVWIVIVQYRPGNFELLDVTDDRQLALATAQNFFRATGDNWIPDMSVHDIDISTFINTTTLHYLRIERRHVRSAGDDTG